MYSRGFDCFYCTQLNGLQYLLLFFLQLLDDGNGAEQLDQPNDADYSIYFTKTAKKFKECKSNGNVIIIVFNLLGIYFFYIFCCLYNFIFL
jgi:hypothetical protein